MNATQLRIFYYHVSQIATSKDSKFTLYLNDVIANVWIKDETAVYINGKWIGSRQAAIQKYTDLVATSFQLSPVDNASVAARKSLNVLISRSISRKVPWA